jgi:hypothetical protein
MSEVGNAAPRSGDERALAMILSAVERLSLAVQAENGDLRERRAVDYPAHSQRKSQGLLELNRLRPALPGVGANPIARAALADLSAQLEINHRLLRTQLKAAQTVSSIIARAVREGQSDGTYAPFAWRVNEG